MFFVIVALLIMLAFYGLYFYKLFGQKAAGIETSNKLSPDIIKNFGLLKEFIMKAAVILTIVAELSSILFYKFLGKMLPGWCRVIGMLIGIAAVIMFWLSLRSMRNNWRVGIIKGQETKLVTNGIYAFSRNPAFVAFDLLFAGILLMFYNPVLLLCSLFSVLMLHIQIMSEEKHLKRTFGDRYIEYMKKVRRYFGKIKG